MHNYFKTDFLHSTLIRAVLDALANYNNPWHFDQSQWSLSINAIFSFLLNMRPSSILFKRPDLSTTASTSTVPSSKRHPFGRCSKPDQHFPRKFLYLLNGTFRIRVGTSWRPDPLKHFKNVSVSSLGKFVRVQFESFCFLLFINFWVNFSSARV